jgi:hypothetical protein
MITLFAALALAQVAPECEGQEKPADYNEQGQQDFLLNFFALATTFSPTHAPIPDEAGHGSVGVELAYIPSLSCRRRFVLDYTKTEDTNKAPIAPRPRATFTLPKLGPVAIFGGVGYVPPLPVFGTRNVIASGEIGAGLHLDKDEKMSLAARYHYTLMKTVSEIATPFVEGEPAVLDFYVGSSFGADVSFGYKIGPVEPYVSAGFTDVSTFFWIGDDSVVSTNLTPYAGFAGSLGAQAKLKRLVLAGEFYTAPGYIYTARVRVGFAI